MNTSGDSYKRIAVAFKKLNENTALYLNVERPDGTQGLRMTQLFSWIDFYADGLVKFKFSDDSTPYVLDLKEKFYSFRLGELSRINGKYALIMLKMWESYRRGKEAQTTISAPLEDWQSWFLEKISAYLLVASMLMYLLVLWRNYKIKCLLPFCNYAKRGRKVVGYEITITDTAIKPN